MNFELCYFSKNSIKMNIYPLHGNLVVRCGDKEKDFVDRNPIAFKTLSETLTVFNNNGIVEVISEGDVMKVVRVNDVSRAVIGYLRKDRGEMP